MNSFEIHGPMFLLFYSVFFVLGVIGAKQLYDQALSVPEGDAPPALTPYEAAYLAGGEARVFLSAAAALSDRNMLKVGRLTRSLEVIPKRNFGLDPIESDLLDICSSVKSTDEAFLQAQKLFVPLKQQLMDMELLATDLQVSKGRTWAFWVLISLPVLVGSFQIVGGLATHRPVGYLIVLFLISLIVSFVAPATFARQRLTNKGRIVLEYLKKENSALEVNSRACPSAMSPPELALAYGLFGAAAAGSSFFLVQKALSRTVTNSGGCGGTGCGGASCSAGSSGGSCGGGGGGCGGGGGGCGGGCGG